jgi:hypothetical protein
MKLISDVLKLSGVNEAAFFRHPTSKEQPNLSARRAIIHLLYSDGAGREETESLLCQCMRETAATQEKTFSSDDFAREIVRAYLAGESGPVERKEKVLVTIRHGSMGYQHFKCRCDICVQWNRDKAEAYRKRKLARLRDSC